MSPSRKNINISSNNQSKIKSSANDNKKSQLTSNSAIFSALQGKNVEIIVAALLLTGKLRVDSVTLYRQASLLVGLTGKYKTLADKSNVNKMVNFLNENGNMTLDEVILAFQQKIQ